MKRLLSALIAALILALSLCSCGQTANVENKTVSPGPKPAAVAAAQGSNAKTKTKEVPGSPEKISKEVEEKITVTVFRCGEYYYAYFPDKTSKAWTLMNFGVPAEITLEDGGFGTLAADVEHTYGGDQGIAFRFENVTGFEQITANEAAEKIGFDEYAPYEDIPYNQIRIFHTDGKEYMIIKIYKSIHVYLDGKAFGVYDTKFEMESALGLREPIEGGGIKMDEHRGVTLLVFRCGNAYLSYSTCAVLNEWMTPILDKDLNNLPTDFSLEDGEIAEIKNTDIIIVNGGDAGYINAPMLTTPAEAVKKSYYEALPHGYVPDWTYADTSSAQDGDCWEYIPDDYNSDYLIIFLAGNYMVYYDNGKEQYLKGNYNTPEEVDAAMGID